MAGYVLRPAVEQDFPHIQKLIISGQINPSGLDWRRFVVIEQAGSIIACGQIKPHRDGCQELASIAVQPEFRGQGIARKIIEHLMAEYGGGPLYLMCRSSLGPLYEKFGFRVLSQEEMPKYFRRVSKLAGLIEPLRGSGDTLLAMGRNEDGGGEARE